MQSRLEIVSGKYVIREVRDYFQKNYGITLTDLRIIDCYRIDEIPRDLVNLIHRLDAFREGREGS